LPPLIFSRKDQTGIEEERDIFYMERVRRLVWSWKEKDGTEDIFYSRGGFHLTEKLR
jgi:hypothetical protein